MDAVEGMCCKIARSWRKLNGRDARRPGAEVSQELLTAICCQLGVWSMKKVLREALFRLTHLLLPVRNESVLQEYLAKACLAYVLGLPAQS